MIYVDEIQTIYPKSDFIRKYGNQWCHLTTDGDIEALHQLAESIGLNRRWFQAHPTHPHYDLTPNMREKALQAGAVFKPAMGQAKERIARWLANKLEQQKE